MSYASVSKAIPSSDLWDLQGRFTVGLQVSGEAKFYFLENKTENAAFKAFQA